MVTHAPLLRPFPEGGRFGAEQWPFSPESATTWHLVCIGTKLAFPEDTIRREEILEQLQRIDELRKKRGAMVE